jgi:hypothetical protein
VEPKPTELVPAPETVPAWVKRKLWERRREIAALLVAAALAKFCGVLSEPVATVCRALTWVAHLLGG